MKPLVYIASPYSHGDRVRNARFQCDVWERLRADGRVVPIAPLWSHTQQLVHPLSHEEWLTYDFDVIARCDALLRLDVEFPDGYVCEVSSGADREVAFALNRGLPVLLSVAGLYRWCEERS